MTVHFVDVQRQAGSADHGVFAIAFAHAVCNGIDPEYRPAHQSCPSA